MDKWNDHVRKWTTWAQERRMSVEFEYWGEDEILERLSRDEHRGRHFFWFNREFFSKEWFENHIKDTISCVGPRYTPELNIELPIASLFDGLGRTSRFYTRITDLYGKMARSYKKSRDDRVEKHFKDEFDLLRSSINELLSTLKGIEEGEMTQINWDFIDDLIDKSRKAVLEYMDTLEAVMEQKTQIPGHSNIISYKLYFIHELSRNLSILQHFIQDTQAKLSNIPALLLVGNAGTGKTHLFCDVAKQRIQSDLPTVLLLGGHFSKGEPWSQIIDSVGVSSKEEFLGALEAAAQVQGTRALILIDALNEGEGKYFWDKHLAGMLSKLSHYPRIGIAVSVRTSYEDIIIPRDLVPGMLLREEHYGFAMHEYQAARTFFEHYGIEQPSIPLLVPEFQNPLFLGLFCKALYNSGLTRIPGEVRGTTWIFNFFISSINEKLSRPENLDFDPKSLLVQKAVENLAEKMADTGQNWLPREEAKAVVDELLSRSRYEESLFRHLVSEGVIAEDRFLSVDSEWCEGIHFSFERLGDHLIAKHLLNKHLNPNDPSQSFAPENPLGALVKDEYTCWRNHGVIEALSIQLPERTGKELPEIAEFCAEFYPVCRAFIESLIWRDPEAITEETEDYINKYCKQRSSKDTFDRFLDALLTVASDPEHPYNANYLHEWMMKCSLAERDSWWSIFIF